MVIDLSFLINAITSLNNFFTNLARSEQMKDIDMKRQKNKDKQTDEDISATTVNLSFEDGEVKLSLNTNDNNTSSTWKKNFYIMAKSLLYENVQELIYTHTDELRNQFAPYVKELLIGGVSI